jgi:hypothetical protein
LLNAVLKSIHKWVVIISLTQKVTHFLCFLLSFIILIWSHGLHSERHPMKHGAKKPCAARSNWSWKDYALTVVTESCHLPIVYSPVTKLCANLPATQGRNTRVQPLLLKISKVILSNLCPVHSVLNFSSKLIWVQDSLIKYTLIL